MNALLTLIAPDPVLFAPYGSFVEPPPVAGQRAFFSDHLVPRAEASAPVLHVNHVAPSALPLTVTRLERHPHAAQIFIPLSVSRYVTLVMPSDANGEPLPDQALGFLMPGTVGVVYHPGVWHAGATVLDATGHFAVLMWRGAANDDEFCTIPSLQLSADDRLRRPTIIAGGTAR